MTAQAVADGRGFTPDRTQRKAWLDIANGIGICQAVLALVTNAPDTRKDPARNPRRACKLHPLYVPYPVRLVGSRPSLALVRLGQVSLSIYVLQVVAGAGRWTIPLHLGVIENPLAYLLLCIFAVVLLPGGAHEVPARLRRFDLFGLRSAQQVTFSEACCPGTQLGLRHSQRQG
jgi:hypothetical protein